MKPLYILSALSFLAAPLTAAIVVTTADGKGADTFIFDRFPTENYGDAETAGVKVDAPNYRRKAYFRFDLTGVSGTATTADLTFFDFADGPENTLVLSVLNQTSTQENWLETSTETETGITWNTAPANQTNSANLLTSEATQITSLTTDGVGRWTEATYSPSVTTVFSSGGIASAVNQALADDDPFITFIITATSSNIAYAWGAFTKEHDLNAAPSLTIGGVIPEPSTYALMFGIGVLGFVIIREKSGVKSGVGPPEVP